MALAPTLVALCFGVTALVVVMYSPKADRPVLVLPLTIQGEERLRQLYSAPQTRILGRSTWGDRLIIRSPEESDVTLFWSDHLLLLNADAPGCQTAGAAT
ncbi:hypothetical protein [Erythrobacter sp. YT30]|uniref:hypothetical protein n=1 Tax=Erythrobacter sp. YT30 TaxID=1735012 RepID=UPI0012E3370D|nr:hypothetical protein [Erythrobacter sp. YT30]